MILHKNLSENYYKSDIALKGADYVYIWKHEIEYIDRVHETVKDSRGNEHLVQLECNSIKYKFKSEDFNVDYISADDYNDEDYELLSHRFIDVKNFHFQFNLKSYYLCGLGNWMSKWDQVCNIISFKYNDGVYGRHWKLNEMKYYPLFEDVYVSGNNSTLENYIPDKMFFKIKDRKKAVNRLRTDCKYRLIEDGYLEMNDSELLKYLSNRLKNKVEYIKMYNRLN